jgi:hypothetical protein
MSQQMKSAVLSLLFGFAILFASAAKADEWDKLTKVTFSAPVEIPGQVLQAGTYVFKLLDSPSDRNIVQIYNERQSKLYATILAVPDYRLKPKGKTVITFEERPADMPEAIQAWFYPGDDYGEQFVYPKQRAAELAKTNNRPVPSMPSNMVANTQMPTKAPTEPHVVALKQAPVKAQQPAGDEVEVAEVFVTPPILIAQANPPVDNQAPATLPTTASPLASIILSGMMIGCLGLMLRFAAKRVG